MHNPLNEDEVSPVVIDLGAARRGELDESYLVSLGGQIEYVLRRMFNPGSMGGILKLKGNNTEIEAFMKALGAEKKYLDSFIKHGLDNPRTLRNRSWLDRASGNFEKSTGLKWPFK